MLAATSASVAEAIEACGMSSVEWKLDGIRLQLHRVLDEVRIYTRNLNDVTERVPGLVALALRSLPADAVVLDGEAVGLGDDERPELFQDTMSRFDLDAGSTLTIRFFDCLHLDGDDLVDRPLLERHRGTRPRDRTRGASPASSPTIPSRPRRSWPSRWRPGTKA